MFIFRSGVYGMGSSPCYRGSRYIVMDSGIRNQMADSIAQMITTVRNAMTTAGWVQSGDYPAHFQFYFPFGLEGYASSPSRNFYTALGLSNLPTGSTIWKYVLYDSRWSGVPAYPSPAPDEIWVAMGASSSASAANLAAAITAWTVTIRAGTAPAFYFDLVSHATGLTAVSAVGDMASSGTPYPRLSGVASYDSQSGAGIWMTSLALPANSPLVIGVGESIWMAGHMTLWLRMGGAPSTVYPGGVWPKDTASIYLAHSELYNIWASPYALAIWEQGDISRAPGWLDGYSNNRHVLITQVYQSADALAENPLWHYHFGSNRLGIASTLAVSSSASSSMITADFFHNHEDNTAQNPSWACYVPRFSEVPAALKSSNATSVMAESLFGLTRGTSSPPCRMYGWIPDTFVMMEDRPLEDVIEYPTGSHQNYICWRSSGTTPILPVPWNRPGGSLYLAIQ